MILQIDVKNVSKSYDIDFSNNDISFREMLMSWSNAKILDKQKEKKPFFALRNVSFQVFSGSSLGIVGENGSGKSTLLKILSRITVPSHGYVNMVGRVASLLEVGTGFHSELTGKENVYLNGAILGMKTREIQKKFDQIISFAGVDKFLDIPVKRYSSGMRLRLAFSIAAHLESDILLIDEILAVGDIRFQKKCIKLIEKLKIDGKTILFVSHDASVVKKICDQAILLEKGEVVLHGLTSDVLQRYNRQEEQRFCMIWDSCNYPGDEVIRVQSIKACNINNKACGTFFLDENIVIEIEYEIHVSGYKIGILLQFCDDEGNVIFGSIDTVNVRWHDKSRSAGKYTERCTIPSYLLNEGIVYVTLRIATWGVISRVVENNIISFCVIDNKDCYGARGDWVGPWFPSVVRPLLKWDVDVG